MKLALICGAISVLIAVCAFVALEYVTLKLPKLVISPDAPLTERTRALEDWFDALEHARKFNGTVLIAREGSTVFERHVGFADAATGRAITSRTSFNLASVSKHITAFAVLLLAHEGKLSLHDPLVRHIPELGRHDGVTLDHLLSHTSGIPDYARSRNLAKRLERDGDILTPAKLIAWLATTDDGPMFTPGEKENYSNSNYALLAEIVARVSGQSFADFLQSRLLTPLGMHRTAVVNGIENTSLLEDRALGFRRRFLYFGSDVPDDLNRFDGVAGDGNIYASARDLIIWDQALRQGALMPAEAYEPAYAPRRLANGEIIQETVLGKTLQPGLGWNVQDFPIVTSYGLWQGFSNFYWRDLENGTTLVVLSNAGIFLRTVMIGEKLVEFAQTLSADQQQGSTSVQP